MTVETAGEEGSGSSGLQKVWLWRLLGRRAEAAVGWRRCGCGDCWDGDLREQWAAGGKGMALRLGFLLVFTQLVA